MIMSAGLAAPGAPGALRCEYLVNPLAVDVAQPRLSWELADPARGAVQSAWQVQAATSAVKLLQDEADLWDSGKVAGGETAQVPYGGAALRSMQRCHWRVRTWDGADEASPWSAPAWWGAGLLEPADWPGAWVQEATPAPSDQRPHNGFHSGISGRADTAKWVAVDLGEARRVDRVVLYPARPFDWREEAPGFLFPLRYRVLAATAADFSDARVVADRTGADIPNPAMEPQVHRFDACEARYVKLEVTALRDRDGERNFAFALAELAVRLGEEERALGAAVTASDVTESGAWSADRLVDGEVLAHPGGQSQTQPAAMLAKDFTLDGPVRRATAYATALGVYELRLNGRRVGDQVLAPEWTDYDDRIQYQAYDVTDLLRAGDNRVGALLGDGWCVGRIGMSQMLAGKVRRVYRAKPALRLRLHVELEDGTTRDIVTDTTWGATLDGPIRVSDILDGEHQDARLAVDGWDAPGGPDWPAVVAAEAPEAALVAQPCEPLRVMETLAPTALTEPAPGVHVFDLGQNMVGWVRLRVKGAAGTVVTLRHAEALNGDGTVYVQNLRGAPQVDRYILRGDPEGEVFEPCFTYHGFRYVEVTGVEAAPAREDLAGLVVYSSAPQAGRFSCDNAMFNQLWENILWTQRANQFSVPTDCPQRDERLGWQGDIQAFAQTAIYNMDVAAFLHKCVIDQRDAQAPDGRFADFAPHFTNREGWFTGAPAWGDAGVMVPWTAYVNYGDVRLLAEHYGAARRWVDYVHGENPDLLWVNSRGNDYNDWLNSDTFENLDLPKTGGAVPNAVFATAFFARSTELLSRMAGVLGKTEDAARYGELAEGIRRAFRAAYVDENGRIQGDTQAGYALALSFELVPEAMRPVVVAHLKEAFERFGGRLSTGIQTTHRLMLELARSGLVEEAYTLANHRDIPSWGFMVDQGATTIWERWDGFVPGRGFQNPGMNSFNHWAFGAVAEWMYACVLGLAPDPEQPGYRHFFVRPLPGGGLTHAEGGYHGIRGEIAVAWRLVDGRFALDLTVPPNTTATVVLPGTGPYTESGGPLGQAEGVDRVAREDGVTRLTVAAGTYRFEGGGA